MDKSTMHETFRPGKIHHFAPTFPPRSKSLSASSKRKCSEDFGPAMSISSWPRTFSKKAFTCRNATSSSCTVFQWTSILSFSRKGERERPSKAGWTSRQLLDIFKILWCWFNNKCNISAYRSRYVMLCKENERLTFANALDEYKQIERVLRHYCHDRDGPEDDEVSDSNISFIIIFHCQHYRY